MTRERSYRGWVAAISIATFLSIALVVAERYYGITSEDFMALAQRVTSQLSSSGQGIVLEVDAELMGTSPVSPSHSTALQRRDDSPNDAVNLLRRPPELASTAFLREPLSSEDFVSLPLTQQSSTLVSLMENMDSALASPMNVVSAKTVVVDEVAGDLRSQRFESLRSPTEIVGKMPTPAQLFVELEALRFGSRGAAANAESQPSQMPRYVTAPVIDAASITGVEQWITLVESKVTTLVQDVGLENPASKTLLNELSQLSDEGRALGEQLKDHDWAASIIRTSYSLQRRIAVWSAIQASLDGMSIALAAPSTRDQVSKAELAVAVNEVEAFLKTGSDAEGWRKYLLIDDLKKWVSAPQEQWRTGNQLARSFLSRVYWARLDGRQKELLQQESINRLSEYLASWGRDPVDYRHLLMSLEQIEQNSSSRLVHTVADTIQVLRNAESAPQKQLAEVLNTHYRNANLRLTVSQSLIERFLPESQVEMRPVRQRILGADTAGDSAVHTQLAVKFHPDAQAWNVELGVRGEVVSSTQSSKGPATFHNSGTAVVNSSRFLTMSPLGYRFSSQPAQVSSTDQLEKMSTDFDGLPVVGDFVRLVVREQFNQKRGLARRITERIIARETDAEIDRKLGESLQKAEKDFSERILGPLQRLTLDPMVVSMSTSEDRLAIRYRLAGETQLSAFTPRPRAPAESLTSFQLHQSVINNTIDRIGLTGKDWRLKELYQNLGKVFEAQWAPPEDIPEDITVRFADHRPITVEMVEGKLRLQLRIANFHREEGVNISNFVVTSTYVPIADGLNAGLVHDPDGTIEIQAKHLPIRDRLALRVIFSKVFVSKPEIPLISDQWSKDERAKGLAVSQLEIRDGWLAVAISEATSPLAAEVAERARNAKAIR